MTMENDCIDKLFRKKYGSHDFSKGAEKELEDIYHAVLQTAKQRRARKLRRRMVASAATGLAIGLLALWLYGGTGQKSQGAGQAAGDKPAADSVLPDTAKTNTGMENNWDLELNIK